LEPSTFFLHRKHVEEAEALAHATHARPAEFYHIRKPLTKNFATMETIRATRGCGPDLKSET
jgi:hypothetical protein